MFSAQLWRWCRSFVSCSLFVLNSLWFLGCFGLFLVCLGGGGFFLGGVLFFPFFVSSDFFFKFR